MLECVPGGRRAAGRNASSHRPDGVLRRSLARGEFDIVALGRALPTDPEWANKIRDGRTSELRGFDRASLSSLVGAGIQVPLSRCENATA